MTAAVAAASTVVLVLLVRDFATAGYAGYEVGLARGAIATVAILAMGSWGLVAYFRRRS